MPGRLLEDALRIWRAGLEAVRPRRLFAESVAVRQGVLTVRDSRGDLAATIDLSKVGRVFVVGGGKAGAAMAGGLEAAFGHAPEAKQLDGLLSVPADCVSETRAIRLVAGRPAGVNEPRAEGAAATEQLLRLVASAAAEDLVICLLSGGGSALLTAPLSPVTVDDKAAVVRLMSDRAATIEEINAVRQQVSRVKGGGLARACRAGRLLTLVVSDVMGDPLDLIASGPTVECRSTPADALAILKRHGLAGDAALQRVVETLRAKPAETALLTTDVTTVMLANNAMAVDAAGAEAERLGYRYHMTSANGPEGLAEDLGRSLAEGALRLRDDASPEAPNCLISGGEPTVELAPPDIRGKGGRNQQLVLAAQQTLGEAAGVAIVSGGTDGEDGPTDAAGAFSDASVSRRARDAELDIADTLRRNDAYTFFEKCDALLRTGPTGTNVCDLRVVTIGDTEETGG